MRVLLFTGVCFLTLGFTGVGQAASTHDPVEAGYFEDLPIVLTPSRIPISLDEAPASVTVLDSDLIRATGYRDIARLLRLVPGMQIGQERSGRHWVTYHGLGSDAPAEMQVLVDGRATYSPTTFNGIDWHTLPVTIDEIERIEVVRGTDPVAFGPNAFLGIINIITRHAANSEPYQAVVNGGGAGIGDLRLAWSGQHGDHALRLAGISRRDRGFANLNDTSRVDTISLRSDHRITNHDEATLRISGSAAESGMGYADSIFNHNGERTMRSGTAAFQTQWRHTPDSGEELLLNYFHAENWRHDAWLAVGPRADLNFARLAYVPLSRELRSTRNSVELQHRKHIGHDTLVLWGGEIRHETMNAPFAFFGQDKYSNRLVRLFGNLELRLNRDIKLDVGGMAEKYSDDRLRLSPRLFTNWKSSPTTTLRAGYSRAWRDQNDFERFADVRAVDPVDGRVLVRPYLPNPDLKRSRIDSTELGYLARTSVANTTLDVRLFDERITDFIIAPYQATTADNPLLSAYLPSVRFENLASPVTLQGIEYQLRSRPWPGTQIILGHSMIRRRTADPAVMAQVSPYQATLSWLQEWEGGWSSMVSLLRMGPVAGGGYAGGNPTRAKAYTTADLRIAHRLRWGNQTAELALAAINLGPRHQEIIDSAQQAFNPQDLANPVSRMVFLSLTVSARH